MREGPCLTARCFGFAAPPDGRSMEEEAGVILREVSAGKLNWEPSWFHPRMLGALGTWDLELLPREPTSLSMFVSI